MDICIGGILDGQKIENHNDVLKIEEHYSDNSSQYVKQHFHGRVKLEVRHKPPN
ncbi:hypothetical protein SAMN02799632_01949 [Acinetobacter pittii]|nr:hypothetical protein SAMN02799632_01949 [Acinetobacter pittii]